MWDYIADIDSISTKSIGLELNVRLSIAFCVKYISIYLKKNTKHATNAKNLCRIEDRH